MMMRVKRSSKGRNQKGIGRSIPCFFAAVLIFAICMLHVITTTSLASIMQSLVPSSTSNKVNIFTDVSQVPKRIDAIFVLGGGAPKSLYEPPVYVQRRCDDAAAIRFWNAKEEEIPILTISAGTAHLPQLLSNEGLPVWESTSSAAYLQKQHNIVSNVYVETTSYDTIGNAFFARINHADIVGWRKIIIITNEFHIVRTKAIFDWIFGVGKNNGYELYYFSSKNVGLEEEALEARKEHEERSAINVSQKLAPQYQTMKEVWSFINKNHDLYTAQKLIAGATNVDNVRSEKLKASYGG